MIGSALSRRSLIWLRSIGSSTQSLIAVAVAERGAPSNTPISPRMSPARSG
jgi:hypothetical protein